jgi:glycosyltransferase involved in cell wall biosynthesis
MIVVKYFYQSDKQNFEQFKKSGGKIIFDVCDLLTFWNRTEIKTHKISQITQKIEQSNLFESLLPLADTLVVPSPYLAKQFQRLTDQPIKVIPDPISLTDTDWLSFLYPVHALPNQVNLLWFGNSGEPLVSGLFDLLTIKHELEHFAQNQSCTLTVISDDRVLFQELESHFKFLKLRFYPWNPNRVINAIKALDALVLPISKNDFALSKSANRSLLALYNGMPVIATETEALQDLSEWIIFDFKKGLQQVSSQKDNHLKNKLATDQHLLVQNHGPQSMANHWDQVFKLLNKDSILANTSVNVSLSGKNVTLK